MAGWTGSLMIARWFLLAVSMGGCAVRADAREAGAQRASVQGFDLAAVTASAERRRPSRWMLRQLPAIENPAPVGAQFRWKLTKVKLSVPFGPIG